MEKINNDIFDIEYTNKDESYIESVIKKFFNQVPDIMEFFNISKFNNKIKIKFWDNLDEYRSYFNKKFKKYGKKVEDWEVARTIYNPSEIHLLSFSERVKFKGHKNDEIGSISNLLTHEFVHTCHFKYNNHHSSMLWFSEGLACYLSNQYNTLSPSCSLDTIMNEEFTSYVNYYTMMSYLVENYDKSYILKLAKDKELLKQETPKIYNGTKKYLSNLHK